MASQSDAKEVQDVDLDYRFRALRSQVIETIRNVPDVADHTVMLRLDDGRAMILTAQRRAEYIDMVVQIHDGQGGSEVRTEEVPLI